MSTALKFGLGTFALAGALVASAAEGVRVGYSAAGASHYNDATKSVYGAEAGGDDFRVVLKGTRKCDTAWYVASDKVAVPAGTAAYAFDFEIFSDVDWLQVTPTEAWCCRLAWYGADGNRIKAETWVDTLGVRHESEKFGVIFRKGGYAAFRIVGKAPAGAMAVTIGFGTDTPNVGPGERVSVRNTRFTALPEGAPIPPPVSPDLTGPSLKAAFVSPSADPSLEVRFTLVDQSEIDWASVRVTSVGTKAEIPFVREGNDIVLKPAGGSWAAGDHHVSVTAKDVLGNKATFCKAFRIGGKPDVPAVTLRKDGVTLVDGKPFFPIGMFAVCPREANLFSLDRAFQDLSAAGVNLVHSYSNARDPEFLGCLGKYGMKAFVAEYSAANGSKWFEETARQSPDVLAWYTGDDTSRVTTPETFANRGEALNALDGRRLIAHADAYNANFRNYVNAADVFMPEIYPIWGDAELDARCVATVIDTMERALADIRLYSPDRPRAVWPLIQYFKGWTSWKRFPTPEELYAMSFAGIIHGGKGITWYTYGGFVQPEKKKFNYGVTSSKEAWSTTTNLTHRLSVLSPVLLAEDVPQPSAPVVLEGPAKDAFGRSSVTMLLKRLGAATYVLAVNACKAPVRARLPFGGAQGPAEVLWEGRAVEAKGGFVEDAFGPFAVHIYRSVSCRAR